MDFDGFCQNILAGLQTENEFLSLPEAKIDKLIATHPDFKHFSFINGALTSKEEVEKIKKKKKSDLIIYGTIREIKRANKTKSLFINFNPSNPALGILIDAGTWSEIMATAFRALANHIEERQEKGVDYRDLKTIAFACTQGVDKDYFLDLRDLGANNLKVFLATPAQLAGTT